MRSLVALGIMFPVLLLAQPNGDRANYSTVYAWQPHLVLDNAIRGTSSGDGRGDDAYWRLYLYESEEGNRAIGLWMRPEALTQTRLITGIERSLDVSAYSGTNAQSFQRGDGGGFGFSFCGADRRDLWKVSNRHFEFGEGFSKFEKLDNVFFPKAYDLPRPPFKMPEEQMQEAGFFDELDFESSFSFEVDDVTTLVVIMTSEDSALLVVYDWNLTFGHGIAPAVFPQVKVQRSGRRFSIRSRLSFATMQGLFEANRSYASRMRGDEDRVPGALKIQLEFGGRTQPKVFFTRELSKVSREVFVRASSPDCSKRLIERTEKGKTVAGSKSTS
jgi:hypothetical protein